MTLEQLADSNLRRLGVNEKDLEGITNFEEGFSISSDFYTKFIDSAETKTGLEQDASAIAQDLLYNGAGLIVVRPDFYKWSDLVLDFLSRNNFKPIFMLSAEIDNLQYLSICEHLVDNPDTALIMPTRTLVYTGGRSCIILVRDFAQRYLTAGIGVPDMLTKFYKGRQGKSDNDTLRGSVVYPIAKSNGFNSLNQELLSIALDPVRDFRNIINENLQTSHAVLSECDYLMEYTSVCIHMPNSAEFIKDSTALLTLDILEDIYNNLFFREQ